MGNTKEVVVIAHDDLDGASCVTLLNIFFNVIKYHFCTYNNIDTTVSSVLKEIDLKNTLLFIVDICPQKPLCDQINSLENKSSVLIIDHHKTKNWLTNYHWAIFNTHRCATHLTLDFIKTCVKDVEYSEYEQFALSVNAYDMWLLSSSHRERGDKLNAYYFFVGSNEFVKQFTSSVSSDLSDPSIKKIVDITLQTRNEQIRRCMNQKYNIYTDPYGRKYTVLLASNNFPYIGHEFLSKNQDVSYVIVANANENKCSVYSEKKDVDVTPIAKMFGGGGHKSASGFHIQIQQNIVQFLVCCLSSKKF